MSCTVEYRRLYCTTADVSFGPRFESDDEGERFLHWMYKNFSDPRGIDTDQLDAYYAQWKGLVDK